MRWFLRSLTRPVRDWADKLFNSHLKYTTIVFGCQAECHYNYDMPIQSLADAAQTFALDLTVAQQAAFEIYFRELVVWNTRMNLTTIVEHDDVIVKHFLDSLSVAPQIPSATMNVIDIGTGAGLPGIPLKIVLPQIHLTLLETTGKKVEFLKHMIAELNLRDTLAIQARAEDLARVSAHREQYAVAVARAVANLAVLAEYALPFVRVGGLFIAQKGIAVDAEVLAATRAIKVLGGRLRHVVPIQLPGLEPRHLILIEKIRATPETFPRRAGIPARQPIQ